MTVIKGISALQPKVMWIRFCPLTHQYRESEPFTYILTLYLSSLKNLSHICCVWDRQLNFSSISMRCTPHPSNFIGFSNLKFFMKFTNY